MQVSMKKLTILGLLVIMFAAGLLMFGGSHSPIALTNVAHAAPPPAPTIRAIAICVNTSTGVGSQILGSKEPIPKGSAITSIAGPCPSGTTVTGGGYFIVPVTAKARVTQSFTEANVWAVTAIR